MPRSAHVQGREGSEAFPLSRADGSQPRPEARRRGLLGGPPFLPPWHPQRLLPSAVLLLSLLPLTSHHHLSFETPMFTFPRRCSFNPLGFTPTKNGFAPVVGTRGLLSQGAGEPLSGGLPLALKPSGRGTPFWLLLVSELLYPEGQSEAWAPFSFPQPCYLPPSVLLRDAHVSGIHGLV